MFDVLWTDPNRELVGERILRKELEAKNRENEKGKHDNARQSVSASSSSSSERGFAFFAPKSRKKATIPSKSDVRSSSPPQSAFDDVADRRSSAFGVKALLAHEDDSKLTVKPVDRAIPPRQSPDPLDDCSSPSSRGKSNFHCHFQINADAYG